MVDRIFQAHPTYSTEALTVWGKVWRKLRVIFFCVEYFFCTNFFYCSMNHLIYKLDNKYLPAFQ